METCEREFLAEGVSAAMIQRESNGKMIRLTLDPVNGTVN